MTIFYKETTKVKCSQFSEDYYFIRNTIETVAAGTALGPEFTTNIYESKDGFVGKYDKENNIWTDIESNIGKSFYAKNGQKFIISNIDDKYPDWAIKEEPPVFDPEKETVLYKSNKWTVYKIQLNEKYYKKSNGSEQIISDYNFDLPADCTYLKPPELASDIQTLNFKDGRWNILNKCVAYLKVNSTTAKEFDDISLVTSEYTVKKPSFIYDEWNGKKWVTNAKKKHIAEFNIVDDTRRRLYQEIVDPLLAEARIKRLMQKDVEAEDFEKQAIAARNKIQIENPWPL